MSGEFSKKLSFFPPQSSAEIGTNSYHLPEVSLDFVLIYSVSSDTAMTSTRLSLLLMHRYI